ncbi:helix-turn-helix transcriptional regulator [Niastella caeni]|uniref:Helix-turn-helix transcriptional regulator n=1 Tax=Niastella caeni TaxID=2569763 RepID=A0A4S8I1U3_9BACT|nr:helix-turn-helix transcriptional regulator [Niastella caeni]
MPANDWCCITLLLKRRHIFFLFANIGIWIHICIHKILSVNDFWPVKNPASIKAFATHLRVLREKAGMSQQELADTAEVSKITIQRIENAKYSVTLDTLISIAEALNVPLKKLVDY